MGCHAVFQGIFSTQGLNLHLLTSPALAGGFFTTHAPPGNPILFSIGFILFVSSVHLFCFLPAIGIKKQILKLLSFQSWEAPLSWEMVVESEIGWTSGHFLGAPNMPA